MVLFNMKCLPFLQKSQDYPFHSITEASRAGRGRGPIRGEGSPLWSEPIYECEQCGACCANHGSFPATGFVFLTKDESKRMKRLRLSVVQASGNSFLGTRSRAGAEIAPVCVAFRGDVGGKCHWSIYTSRPRACRRFEVGSLLCREARAAAGLGGP